MTKILACVPMSHDATSYYRSYGVFPNLKKHHIPDIWVDDYLRGGKRTWAELLQYDIIFLQRPAHGDWLLLAKYCKSLGKKIWIDHDDNLFQLPPYNRVVNTYTTAVKKNMLDIIKIADVVTVSTKAIQSYFLESFGVNSVVVPNALNDEVTPMVAQYNEVVKDENFVWRGSETHQFDCLQFAQPIGDAMEERKNAFWHFMGYNPYVITMAFEEKKYKYWGEEDIMVYYNNLKSIRPQMMHVPLVLDPLNQCKSNIAWIEATAAGAVTIAPDWHEWRKPGVLNYNTPEEYLSMLMRPLDDAPERWAASRDYINENLLLTKVNLQRKEIINNLMAWH